MNKKKSKYFNTARRMDEALISLLKEKSFEYVTIKEICAKAKVNRSTFYLHYESLGDLLLETIQLVEEKFLELYTKKEISVETQSLDELFFMTDEWMIPYLNFVKENKCMYLAIHKNTTAFSVEKTFYSFFSQVFSPILSRYGVSPEKHEYMMTFYRQGLTAVVMKWVEHDCQESVEEMTEIIKTFFTFQKNENNDRKTEK